MKKPVLLLLTAIAILFSQASQAQCVFALEADKDVCVHPGYSDTVDVHYTLTTGTSTSITWTTSGTGTFSPYFAQAYKYSAADLAAGSVTLTATLHGGTCDGASDQINITFIRTIAGADLSSCDDTIDLSGAVTSGYPFQWYPVVGSGTFLNNTSLNTSYTPSDADITRGYALIGLKLTNNPSCLKEDTMRISLIKAPAPKTSLNHVSCGNPSIVYAYNAYSQTYIWSTSGSGVFSDASNDTTTYTPSAADLQAGGVVLTFTSSKSGCQPSEASTFVTYVTNAQVNAGADQTVCGTRVLLNGSVNGPSGAKWTSSGTGTFLYNAAYLTNYYTFSAADRASGSVTLTLTTTGNGSCAAVSDQKIITIPSASTVSVNAGPDQVSASALTLNGSINGSSNALWSTSGSGTFTPSAASLNATYTPSSADLAKGYVILTLTSDNGGCGITSDKMYATLGSYSTISGTVKAGNAALDNGYLYLFKVNGTYLELFRKDSVSIGQNGNYTFQYIPSGMYVIYAAPTGTSAYYASHLPTYLGDVISWEDAAMLTVSNASYTGKNITLAAFKSAQLTWNTGNDTIAGAVFYTPPASGSMRLIGTNDVPLSGATVYLKNTGGGIIAYTNTNANGAYAFKKIVSGNYLIEVEYPGAVVVGNSLNVAADGVASTIESGTVIVTGESLTLGTLSSSTTIILNAYPNPANEFVQIALTTSSASCTVQITDALGAVQAQYQQVITNPNTVRIALDQFRSGVYLVKITDGENTYTSKVIKY